MAANGMQELETPKNVEITILILSKLMKRAVLVVVEENTTVKGLRNF